MKITKLKLGRKVYHIYKCKGCKVFAIKKPNFPRKYCHGCNPFYRRGIVVETVDTKVDFRPSWL